MHLAPWNVCICLVQLNCVSFSKDGQGTPNGTKVRMTLLLRKRRFHVGFPFAAHPERACRTFFAPELTRPKRIDLLTFGFSSQSEREITSLFLWSPLPPAEKNI